MTRQSPLTSIIPLLSCLYLSFDSNCVFLYTCHPQQVSSISSCSLLYFTAHLSIIISMSKLYIFASNLQSPLLPYTPTQIQVRKRPQLSPTRHAETVLMGETRARGEYLRGP